MQLSFVLQAPRVRLARCSSGGANVCLLSRVQLFLSHTCNYTIIPPKKKLTEAREERRQIALEERKTRDREQREEREREARAEALANAIEEIEEILE